MIVHFPRYRLADKQFAALGSPARRQILSCLACGPMRADDLAEYVEIGTSTICHHLNVLQAAGLARRSRWPLWEIVPDGVASLEAFIHAFFHEQTV